MSTDDQIRAEYKAQRAAQIAKLKAEVGVGLEISALINNETVKKTLDGLLHGIQNRWLATPDRDQRELLWQKALGVQEFVATLGQLIDTGKMAAHQLDSMKNDEQQTD